MGALEVRTPPPPGFEPESDTGITSSAAPAAPPPGFEPEGSSDVTAAPEAPSFLSKLNDMGESVVNAIPGVGEIHQGAAAAQKFLARKAAEDEASQVSAEAKGRPESKLAHGVKQFALNSLSDVAGLAHGATSPAGLATAAAGAIAPEIVGPALFAHGVYRGVKGWGDVETPEGAREVLGSAAEAVGGAAMTGAGVSSVRSRLSAKSPQKAQAAFQNAIPPSKSAPYADADYVKAQPYLKAEHASSPITTVEDLRDAADSAVKKIEDKVSTAIQSNPNVQIDTGKVMANVRQSLSTHPRSSFVDSGIKELEDFKLDQPKNLAEADAIRRTLNYDNQAVLARNNYKAAVARATDPAFAAREAAAEELRDQIYANLPGFKELRLDEGSLLKIRNAAQQQYYNGEKKVSSSVNIGPARKTAKALTKAGMTAAGSAVGGPAGAVVGAGAGEAVGSVFTPEALTRNKLINLWSDESGELRLGSAKPKTSEPETYLYHGTSSPKFTTFKDAPAYLTDDPVEAKAYASNPILGGGRGASKPRVLKVSIGKGTTKDINSEIDDAIFEDGDVDQVIAEQSKIAKSEGHRFLKFNHPGTTKDQIPVTISLYPKEDLKIRSVSP